MIYGSVCSGIESATAAWHPLGWRPAFFSEIDKFPRAVLQHHHPQVPLHGDFRTIKKGDYEPIQLLVGGTPCQDFSIAGLRKGFAGDRGNLTFEFVHLAERLRPEWLVWENVPGCLSIDGGRGFGTFLGMLAKLGYGFAYRVLDAQYFNLAQRRACVFVVARLGDWRSAAAVLFERESLSGNPPPSRETGKGFAADVVPSLTGSGRGVPRPGETRGQDPVIAIPILEAGARTGASTDDIRAGIGVGDPGDPMFTLQAGKQHAIGFSCKDNGRADGFDASEDGTGRGTPPVACQGVALRGRDGGATAELMGDLAGAVRASQGGGDKPHVLYSIMPQNSGKDYKARAVEVTQPLMAAGPGSGNQGGDLQQVAMRVRRLTPRECCRLQGFPDDFLDILYRGKPAADGPKYKALGNSKAVPVVNWIGQRIEMVRRLKP